VREGLAILERFPGQDSAQGKRKLRVAVTPTFARSMLMPRLRARRVPMRGAQGTAIHAAS